jgi:purine-nucleoside phosphorylase
MTELLDRAITALRAAGAGRPAVAVVLGSGFGEATAAWPVVWRLPYDRIPQMPACSVNGHAGELTAVRLSTGAEAWVFAGRLHSYEGFSPEEVVLPVDLAAAAGARKVLLTCAAGGIREDLHPGQLVLVSDHLNFIGWLPPLGDEPCLDLSCVYDPEVMETLSRRAAEAGQFLHRGVLAAMPGPVYETPAEVRMLATLGADLVSMSTVPEAIRARALNMQVAALACIANPAAGRGTSPLDHGAVLTQVSRSMAAGGDWLLAGLNDWVAGTAG